MFSSIAMNMLLLRFKRSLLKSASITNCRFTSILTSPGNATKNRNSNYTKISTGEFEDVITLEKMLGKIELVKRGSIRLKNIK